MIVVNHGGFLIVVSTAGENVAWFLQVFMVASWLTLSSHDSSMVISMFKATHDLFDSNTIGNI